MRRRLSRAQDRVGGARGSIASAPGARRCSDRMLDEPALTLYRGGEVRAFHNLNADWGASFAVSTRHFLDVLAGRAPEEALTGQDGRRVIALYNLFQRSNAERRAVTL